ncbi:NACHT domain-containing protein [Phlyctema vagabunda]|uniref:NACHT domain-containing protein n=1 Tax=Phlyctema vagabunda TaxID=108571 RepID=A0ABR4PVG2_9HELO
MFQGQQISGNARAHVGNAYHGNVYNNNITHNVTTAGTTQDPDTALRRCISWLSVDDEPQEFEYKRMSDQRHQRTCEWIAKAPQMTSWIEDDSSNRILWLSGKPGADGLDECSELDQKSILKELQAICLSDATRCKLLFTSQKTPYIGKKLFGKSRISLDDTKDVQEDIQTYVRYKVTKLRTSNSTLLEKLEKILTTKADGMFIWVRLVIEELRNCYTDADIEATALKIPKGLEKAYGRILSRIKNNQPNHILQSTAIRILEWMACSFRLLKSYEILDGIVFKLPTTLDDSITHPACTVLDHKTKFQKEVLDLCRPLIEDGTANTIDFVHFSAKQFILEQPFQGSEPFINIEKAHLVNEERVERVLCGLHGLQLYANQYWYQHLLSYCKIVTERNGKISEELKSQLYKLLEYRIPQRTPYTPTNDRELSELSVLNKIPQIKALVYDAMSFRSSKSQHTLMEQNSETVAQKLCTEDPTFFSTTQYHYQVILESILKGGVIPNRSSEDLRKFKELYGPAAFVCRYSYCPRAGNGFGSIRQRDEHESQHQKKFRCAIKSCVSYASGFTNKRTLEKHNQQYHAVIATTKSLRDIIESKKQENNLSRPSTPQISNHDESPPTLLRERSRQTAKHNRRMRRHELSDPNNDTPSRISPYRPIRLSKDLIYPPPSYINNSSHPGQLPLPEALSGAPFTSFMPTSPFPNKDKSSYESMSKFADLETDLLMPKSTQLNVGEVSDEFIPWLLNGEFFDSSQKQDSFFMSTADSGNHAENSDRNSDFNLYPSNRDTRQAPYPTFQLPPLQLSQSGQPPDTSPQSQNDIFTQRLHAAYTQQLRSVSKLPSTHPIFKYRPSLRPGPQYDTFQAINNNAMEYMDASYLEDEYLPQSKFPEVSDTDKDHERQLSDDELFEEFSRTYFPNHLRS